MAVTNASFTLGATSVSFDAISDGFEDRGAAVEEWKVPLIIYSAADWGALFGLRTPRELISIRMCPSGEGSFTPVIDVGGGAGRGALSISGLDNHTALLTDLTSQAPVGDSEVRNANAVFIVTGA